MEYDWTPSFYADAQLQSHMDAVDSALRRRDRDAALSELAQAVAFAKEQDVPLSAWMVRATSVELRAACVAAIVGNGWLYH